MKKFLLVAFAICLSYCLYAAPVHEKIKEKSIRLSNGVSISYVQQGKGKSTPVILIHGFSDSWHSYEKVLPLLPDTVNVYAVSLRGHGLSDKPATGYSPLDLATDISLFMDALQIPKAFIVGHSLGATVAQSFCVNFPAKTQGVVLVAAFASFAEKESIGELRSAINAMKGPVADKSFAEEFQRSTITRPVGDDFLATAVTESLRLPIYVWKNVINELEKTNLLNDLSRQVVKTLIIWGDKDPYSPLSDQERLRLAMKGATLSIYEGTGHAIHWEEPEKFAKEIVQFTGNR